MSLPSSEAERASAAPKWFKSLDEEVPSISLGRTHHVDNKHVSTVLDPSSATSIDGPVPPPRLAGIREIRLPHRDDPRASCASSQLTLAAGNHKHAHRVNGVEGTVCHRPQSASDAVRASMLRPRCTRAFATTRLSYRTTGFFFICARRDTT